MKRAQLRIQPRVPRNPAALPDQRLSFRYLAGLENPAHHAEIRRENTAQRITPAERPQLYDNAFGFQLHIEIIAANG
jgi:hypothetical protein